MLHDREARGSRARGDGRLRTWLILVVVLALASAPAAAVPALGSSGGTGLGGPGHRSRPPGHRSPTARQEPRHRTRPGRGRAPIGSPSGRHAARRRAVSHAHSGADPLLGRAMWIWELPYSNGGNLTSIVATARQYGVSTLLIKSTDATSLWSQFTPQLVATLHAAGLRVCAWQYVYGNHPVTEAYRGAAAVRGGADCLVIDAETEYEGKYIAAQTYVQRLRTLIGNDFPVALAGFPYVDYHPGFPYSVFLGPGGAQDNVPQMYWKDIGSTVDGVFAHAYSWNLIYGRSIHPLGQLYNRPPTHQIVRFRQLSRAYGAPGISWWDWQEATASAWSAVSRPTGTLAGYVPFTLMAAVGPGDHGDVIVWAQEHLISAGYSVGVDGGFGAETQSAVQAFQLAHGLTGDGVIGPATWQALLLYPPARVIWGRAHHTRTATVTAASARRLGPRALRYAPVPKSARRPARRNEIAGSGGAGRSARP